MDTEAGGVWAPLPVGLELCMRAAVGYDIAGFEKYLLFRDRGLGAHYWIHDRGMAYSKGYLQAPVSQSDQETLSSNSLCEQIHAARNPITNPTHKQISHFQSPGHPYLTILGNSKHKQPTHNTAPPSSSHPPPAESAHSPSPPR
jgi:hypothetical protein